MGLLGFAFLTGLGLGPLLSMAIMVNPSLVPSAFMLTSAIFACFTGAALFAPDGKYLYLGGTLLSGLSLLLFGFLNIFFRSQLLFQARLYIGLAIFCGFIMFDTQVIIRKARNGDKDSIAHSLDLFIDLSRSSGRFLSFSCRRTSVRTRTRGAKEFFNV